MSIFSSSSFLTNASDSNKSGPIDELVAENERLRRSLKRQGLRPVYRKPYRKPYRMTTDSDHDKPLAPNVLDRRFDVCQPDQAWVAVITYIPTACTANRGKVTCAVGACCGRFMSFPEGIGEFVSSQRDHQSMLALRDRHG